MADRADLVAVCDRYVELLDVGDTDGIMELYAEDCWIEDPVGSDRKTDREEIRRFYAGTRDSGIDPRMTRTGPVCVCAGQAAFQFRIDIDLGETKMKMTSIDVMTFDEAGKITSMRAFPDLEADPDA